MTIEIKTSPEFIRHITGLIDVNKFLRVAAFDGLALMTERIHENGKATDGSAIGQYSKSYLKLREKKGKGSGTAIIVSFTRQLQNSWAVTGSNENGWVIGFLNTGTKDGITSAEKLSYVETQTGKTIGKLSKDEIQHGVDLIIKEMDASLSQ